MAFAIMLVLVMLSPKYDAKNRGFVACTHNLLDGIVECDHTIGCSMGVIIQSAWCDIKMVGSGIKNWAEGRQAYPWSNYIYEPETPKNQLVDEEARIKYLEQYPDTKAEMEEKHRLRKELENEQNTSENNEISWPDEK